MQTDESVDSPTKDASDAVLPAELFPFIADALVCLKARKTLLELLCANRTMHLLCLPSLMREIVISTDRSAIREDLLPPFARDALKTGKFALVKSLVIKDPRDGNGHIRSALVNIWNGLVNLEKLEYLTPYEHVALSSLVWFLLNTSPMIPLRSMGFDTSGLAFIQPDAVSGLELPVAIRKVTMTLRGTPEQHLSLFLALDGLPILEYLGLKIWNKTLDRQILTFPKIPRCLRWAYVY